MREYLKAIGFSDLNSRKKIDELIYEIKKNPSRKNWFQIDEEEAIFIYEKDFAEAVGIAIIEVMDRDGYRVTDHFYPYVRGANYLYHEDLEFEHYTDKEGYAGICDENNIGIPLIFHVNNPVDYLKIVYGKFHDKINSITLSGMSKKGMIILPVEKDEFQEREERKGNELRNEMIDAAKAGDEMALEVMKTVSHYLGLALAQVALTVDPEIFVIGGGVSKAGQFLIDMIQKDYDHFTPISENKAKLGLATLGNDAGIYGAARLVL